MSAINLTGSPATITASGSASIAANNMTLLTSPVPNQPGVFYYGPNQTSLSFGNGTRCVCDTVIRLSVVGAGSNVLSYAID
ncbi:MAG: hypothetical protein ACI841_000260 [Planctomycetota bacterium]|jgi:hypothetical protein